MLKDQLLQRLEGIGESLARRVSALMLLGLGSVGLETVRLDEYSDLGFFVIVGSGHKQHYLDRLDWLEEVYPLAYAFRNTRDGFKIMFYDGIYGEFAVYEEEELATCAYHGGRIVWHAPGYDTSQIAASSAALPPIRGNELDHPLNEALTNLYVGLCRYLRGEKLSATRFVQNFAVDSIISVLHLLEQEVDYFPDPFGNERRIEKRFPQFAAMLGEIVQGYQHVPESALRILRYLEQSYNVNRKMSDEIRRLASLCE